MSNRFAGRPDKLRTSSQPSLAMWGGIECTVNRVGEVYQDQVLRTGHHHRPEDMDCLARLGVKTVRYPVLWERTAPFKPDDLNWRWSDERLAVLQQRSIRPVVGLVHHGCGPHYATFERSAFEREFPRYARHVAERYPWVEMYTPINEPLTTARFSGLYGHWYPHASSDRLFVDLLLRECRATVRAMREIRCVQPNAQLVQTDDLGYTHSTSRLAYQAEFENCRRWLTWDLLCGHVTPDHPMWSYLRWAGASEQNLWFHVENPCPPSVIGINHYVTSERYLDDNVRAYPAHQHAGNGRHAYVDTEVVRAAPGQRLGLGKLLMQAWQRYNIPLVVTEAHLGCSVDEQMRWLGESWQQALLARCEGADVQAVTAWAVFGMYDWHCMLTRCENLYEPGVYCLRDGKPEPTDLTRMVQQLAAGESVETLVPRGPGWWQAKPPILCVV
ncbi:glycoside hydrolase [Fibrisoma montanum]|uniref:Glycoside hydrolase n=1 Tax=Fibrisoma montanum TaxID=2305895 RepID=A0A418M4K8_9BACT|nr:family 1 glycosylhydrolase [Fibrisoma montanum]RIV20745.1 glycoside hydrolase [Fibrisoma montanum]